MNKYILIISLLFGFNAQAGLITIGLSDADVVVGESITVNLIASDFSPLDAFDAFDFDFAYDNSLFAFNVGSLSSDLSLIFPSPLIFGASENLNGLAISFADFSAYTNTDFLLASFEITATSAGIANFSLSNVSFSNFFTPVVLDTSMQTSANISAAVPEPSTWLMLLSALFMIGRINRSA